MKLKSNLTQTQRKILQDLKKTNLSLFVQQIKGKQWWLKIEIRI